MIDRRTFLTGTLASAAALSLRGQSQPASISSMPLGENLFLLTGAGANVVVRVGGNTGNVMVDGGLAEHAADLAKAVSALPCSAPVKTLYNTHWHPEQTGSNLFLRREGATVIAHENTRLWMSTDVTRPWETRTFTPSPKEAQPTRTFYDKDVLKLDGEEIQSGYLLQAHTDGDIYVHFTKANVLCIGDIVAANAWPFVDWWTGGWIFGIVAGLETLLKVANADTRIVPGQGGVMTRAELEEQHKMFSTIAQRLRKLLFGGRNIEDALAAEPTKEYDARMGDPKQFIQLSFQSMWGHFTPDA